MNDPALNQPDQNNDPITLPSELRNSETRFDRTLWYTIGGIVFASCCGLILLGFLFSQKFPLEQFISPPKPIPFNTIGPETVNTPYSPSHPTPNKQATQAAWTKPSAPPVLGNAVEVLRARNAKDTENLKKYATYYPNIPKIIQPGDTFFYGIRLESSRPLLWDYGWCTLTARTLEQNFDQMKIEFFVNGDPVPSRFIVIENDHDGENWYCRTYHLLVTFWPEGIHRLEVNITFLEDTNDGWEVYPAGTHTFEYLVTVKP